MGWYQWRLKAVAAKTETTYGVSASPAYATDLLYLENVVLTPVQGQAITRQIDLGTMSHELEELVGKYVTITFDIPLHTSGVIAEPPPYAHILQACTLAETITPAPSPNEGVVYTPVLTGVPSVTLGMRIDGLRQVIVGCRGTMRIRASIPGMLYASITMTGIYAAPVAEAMPTAAPTVAYTQAIPTAKGLTTVTLGGVALSTTAVEIDLGATIQYSETTEVREVRVLRRSPTATITCEADIAARNWFGAADGREELEFIFAHGTGPDRMRVRSTVARIGQIGLTDINGATGLTIPLRLRSTSTDPDFQLVYKAA